MTRLVLFVLADQSDFFLTEALLTYQSIIAEVPTSYPSDMFMSNAMTGRTGIHVVTSAVKPTISLRSKNAKVSLLVALLVSNGLGAPSP